jgi:hypothetical protein
VQRPFHPWLLSLFPILHLFSQNVGLVTDAPVPLAMGFSLAITTLLVFGLRAATGSLPKAALITSLLLFWFYSYGHLAASLDSSGFKLALRTLPYVSFAVTGALVAIIWVRPARAEFATAALNVATIVLLVTPTFASASYLLESATRTLDDPLAEVSWQPAETKLPDGPGRPDIYYIITDGYSSNEHLRREYDYDNSRFTDALEELGFYVAYDSRSNYGATLLSLASSLNMRYMPTKAPGTGIDDLVYLRMLIADNAVSRFLLERGYTYVYMLSGYLLPSRLADVNLDFSEQGVMEYDFSETQAGERQFDTKSIVSGNFYKEPFSKLLVETSLLRIFHDSLEPFVQSGRSYRWSNPRRFQATLEELKRIPARPEATFTFVHLMEPHGPVQLGRDGKKLRESRWWPSHEEFFAELEFVNEQLIGILRSIVESSKTPPIIILQADHGSDRGNVWTRDKRLTHFEIMHALHLPGGLPAGVTRDLSPINSFGVLLRAYFGAEYEEQDLKLFDVPRGYKAPFEQKDVTAEFR